MAHHVRPFELGERGVRDHLEGLAGRIGEEVNMRARQGMIRPVESSRDKPLHIRKDKSGTVFVPTGPRIHTGGLPTGMAFIRMLGTTGISFD